MTTAALAAVAAIAVAAPAGAAGAPAVKFTGQPHATGGAEVFTIKTTGFEVDAKDVGKANEPGMGHIHFQMDGGKFDLPKYSGANGKLAVAQGRRHLLAGRRRHDHLQAPPQGHAHPRGVPRPQQPLQLPRRDRQGHLQGDGIVRIRTLLGVLVAVAAATPLATTAPAHPVHGGRIITIRMGEYFFTPKIIRAHVGDVLLEERR